MQLTKEDLAAIAGGMNLQGAQVNIGAQNVTYSGNIVNHAPDAADDANVKEAIQKLMKQTRQDGEPVFETQGQWYAVFRILVDYHQWPDNMAEFCRRVSAMHLQGVKVECKEDSLKKINALPPFFKPFDQWQPYNNPLQYDRLFQVAQSFKQLMDGQ